MCPCLSLTVDVVEETKPQMEGKVVLIHDEVELVTSTSEGKTEQNGAQMMADEVGSALVRKEVKPSVSGPKYSDEISQVVEKASTEASLQEPLKSEALVIEEKAFPVLDPQEEGTTGADDIRKAPSDAEDQTEGEDTKFAECSRIERKFSCSQEASVDVHSEDSEKRDATDSLKTVSIVDHALVQEDSEEFAGVAQKLETEPTLAAKWSHEVSVNVFFQDEWVEGEMNSAAEPEPSAADVAPSFPSEEPSPSGKSVEWELVPTQVETSNVVRITASIPSFTEWERATECDARTTDAADAEPMEDLLESTSSTSKQSEGIDGDEAHIKKQIWRIWNLKHLKTRPAMVEPRTVTQQAIRPAKLKAPKVVGLSWPPTPLTAAEDEHYANTDDRFTCPRQGVAEFAGATETIVAEPKEELLESEGSPTEQSQGIDGAEANIEGRNLQRIWSLKYLKTRPVVVEPRTVTQQALKPVKPKAPKFVGLSWPPAPLTTAEGVDGVFT